MTFCGKSKNICYNCYNMDTKKYQEYIMWKAEHPKKREPLSFSAFLEEHELTIKDIEVFTQYKNYGEDLNRATRFLMVNEMPDLMWSLYDKVKTKQKGSDLESLYRLLFDPKVTRATESAQEVFTAFDETLTEEQKRQIAERYGKHKG